MGLRKIGAGVVGLATMALMLVTVVDVVGRYFLSAPLRGSNEMMEFGLAAMLGVALPLVSAQRGHIVIGLIDNLVGPAGRRWQVRVVELVAACATSLIAGFLAFHSTFLFASGVYSQYLRVTLWPVAVALSAAWCVTACIHLANALRQRGEQVQRDIL